MLYRESKIGISISFPLNMIYMTKGVKEIFAISLTLMGET